MSKEEEHIEAITALLKRDAPPEMTDDDLRYRAKQLIELYKVLIRKPPKHPPEVS